MASIFDIFTTDAQTKAAQDQIAGLNNAFSQASGNINQGIDALTKNYTSALQPYLQNYTNANAGVTQLGNVLGLNGPQGNATALQTLQATPGYQFALNQGDAALNAQAAATGKTGSGNQALALSDYNRGAAAQNYNNYVWQLQPYLNASNAAAGGIGNIYTGLGNATANQYGTLANLAYGTQTGIGNANANADLAGLTASGNLWNLIGSVGGAALGAFGGLGGLGGGASYLSGGSIPGAIGATSVNGAPLSGGSFLGNLGGSIFSDARLKEDIEKVGELYDGTGVFRYTYKGDDVPRIGVMAQEVEQRRPDAVTEIGGYKAVDYAKATDLAASLARFMDDNVVDINDYRAPQSSEGYGSTFSRFLEAA